MKPVDLRLGPLEINNITQATCAFLGNKGTGKTSDLKMASYQLSQDYQRLDIVLLDPLNVIGIAGFHRVRVTRKSADHGADLAKLLNKPGVKHVNVIISFPGCTQKEQNTFANAFFERWNPQDTIIGIDEIHDFCPQSGHNYCDEIERAVRHWRNLNDGFMMTSQRIAKCNKNVLELCDVLAIHRMVGNNDRRAVEDYLGGQLSAERVAEIMTQVQTLPKGEAYLLNFRDD